MSSQGNSFFIRDEKHSSLFTETVKNEKNFIFKKASLSYHGTCYLLKMTNTLANFSYVSRDGENKGL
jgi:hypothetical protein